MLASLDHLARARLVRLGETGWAPFHDSVSELLISSMSREERPGLHLRLATALEREQADRGEVAGHMAGTGDHAAAAHAYADAAAARLARFADEEAVAIVEAGLSLPGAEASRESLLSLRAEARFRLGDLGGARQDLRAVLSTSSGAERSLRLARLAMMEAGAEDYWRARELAELAAASAGRHRRARAEAWAAGARIALNLGDLDEAERQARRAEALFKELADAGGLGRMIDVQAVVVLARGRILDALPRFEEAVHLFGELGELVRIVFPRCYLANCFIQSGRAPRGLEEVAGAMELALTLGWAEGETFAAVHASMAHAALGSGEQAVSSAQHAPGLARRIGHREWICVALRTLGYAFVAVHQLDRAEDALRESLEHAGRLPIHAPWSAAGLALTLTRLGRLEEASDLVATAISGAGGGWPTVRHEVDLAEAELMAARGDPQARRVAAGALARAEADGYVLHAARLRELTGGTA